MTIFAVFRAQKPELLGSAIAREFPDDYLQISDDQWLISADMTPKEVSDKVGITGGDNGSAIIFSMRGYYGRAPTDVWEWIKVKAEGFSG